MAGDVTSPTSELLSELHEATGRSAADLVSEAVQHLYRRYIGLHPADPDAPKIATGPFRKRYSDRWAEVVLRQIDPIHFQLDESFRFVGRQGTQWVVPTSDVSDLASVPPVLTWLVPRYGRHTLAALLHDHLQKTDVEPPIGRREADDVFRDAMGETGVPLLQRWLMWSAVSAMTRVNAGGAAMVATAGWVLGYGVVGIVGVPKLVWMCTSHQAGRAFLGLAIALASPFIVGLLWGDDYLFAAVAGLSAMLIGFAVAFDAAVSGIYAGLETASRAFQRRPNPIRRKKLPRRPRSRRPWELIAARL
jgi:hypothetical protein